MNILTRLPKPLVFLALLTVRGAAQNPELAFSNTMDAYNNILAVRLRLSQPPGPADPKPEDSAVAAALADPFQDTADGAQLWRIYYREAPSLFAAIKPESLEYLSKSYQKVLAAKKPVHSPLFEGWMLDLRFILLNPQADALLKDPTRMNYTVLLGYGVYLATAEKTTEGKMQRAMGQGGLRQVKAKLADAVKNADANLTKKAGAMAAALGADAKSWEEFRTWFAGL